MLNPARSLRNAGCLWGLTLLIACSSVDGDESDSMQDSGPETTAEGGSGKPSSGASDAARGMGSQDLVAQKQALLFDTALGNARSMMEQGEYEAARGQLEQAIQIDPTNAEALRKYYEVLELLGERPGEIITSRQVFEDRARAKREAMRLEAEEFYRMGQDARERGEYEVAIRSFERVEESVRWSSLDVDWGDLATRNEQALAAARNERDAAEKANRESKLQKAFTQIQEDDAVEAERERKRVATLLEKAALKFERSEYDASIELCDQALNIDAGNTTALDLKDSALEARRAGRETAYGPKRREAYRRWMREIDELRIPYSEKLTAAPAEYWENVMRRTSESEIGIEPSDPENERVRELLKTTIIPNISFEDDDLATVTTVLSSFSGLTVLATPEVTAEMESSGELITLPSLSNLSVESILKIVSANLGEDFSWTVRDGVVMFTTLEESFGETIIRTHPIQDLTFSLTDFKGPEIDRIALPGEYGDDAETSVFASDIEGESIINPEDIVNLIRENVARESWDLGDDKFQIDVAASNQILVIHTPEVQREISAFLDDLRRFSSTVVQIESRFIEVTDAFLEEFAADFRGLGGTAGPEVALDDSELLDVSQGLDNLGSGSLGGASPSAGLFFNDNSDGDVRGRTENFFSTGLGDILSNTGGSSFQFTFLDDTDANLVVEAVSKSVNATEVMAPVLTVFNTERAYVTVINEISFLQDFDVDVANTAFIANPEIGILQEGVVLDVRPTISYDREYITLEVRTTVAEVKRPIDEFETTLGGFTDAVTFQMPQMRVDNANTTVRVPDGGTVMLGGLRTIRHINRRATSPWLGDLPLVGFLFSEKGVVDEAQTLTIMVRAEIKDLGPYRESLPIR